jgi:2-polyprenyl-3-methyl-5-hydroxy-6-metoxy-1,4-benzoquinol methylase
MDDYHHLVRREITPLLPGHAGRILDVGCGAGATARWLKSLYPSATTIGIEGVRDLKSELAANVDEAIIHDLNEEPPDVGAPDLILFLDVLEHLVDPAAVLSRFASRLAPGGAVIVSVPNVAHPSVVLPLAIKGQWTYADAGILDRTHLRFFTHKTAVELVEGAGFHIDAGLYSGLHGPKARLFDRVTLGRLRPRMAKQFIMRGVRGQAGRPVWSAAAAT